VPELLFDTVITRAFSTLAVMKEKTQHLLNEGGEFLAMKGQYPLEELKELGESVWEVYPLKVPFLNEVRHLVRVGQRVVIPDEGRPK
jgi:16S rRNA (guanine527-N7)-methyltransferase